MLQGNIYGEMVRAKGFGLDFRLDSTEIATTQFVFSGTKRPEYVRKELGIA